MRTTADDADLRRRALLTTVALAPILTAAKGDAADASLPAELAAAVNEHTRATTHNDIAALETLVTDDYVLVNSDSTLQNKQSYLDDFKLPGFKIDPYVMEQSVHKVWGHTALTGGLLHSPMVALNHAIAAAMVHGPRAGLDLLARLDNDAHLRGTHRLEAVRAHLLERADEQQAAAALYRAAATKTTSIPERNYLLMRAAWLSDGV